VERSGLGQMWGIILAIAQKNWGKPWKMSVRIAGVPSPVPPEHKSRVPLLSKKLSCLWFIYQVYYEGESVDRSQMDIKHKTCEIWTWKKTFISCNILHQHWCICPTTLPVCQNPHHRSLLTVVSATCATWLGIICSFRITLREFPDPVVNHFTLQTLPTVNRKHFFMTKLCIKSFCPQRKHIRMLFFDSTLLKHSCHFNYWNQPINMRMCVCYLDCHEAGLCCYWVTHVDTYYIHYSYFTSICDLFIESSSYYEASWLL
jgi:hypothetical protein